MTSDLDAKVRELDKVRQKYSNGSQGSRSKVMAAALAVALAVHEQTCSWSRCQGNLAGTCAQRNAITAAFEKERGG